MAATSFDHAEDARAALHAIASDPVHGPAAFDSAQVTANLLQDLLPDAPRETGLIVAAVGAGLPVMLRANAAQGMDIATSVNLAAAALADRTAFAAGACEWVTIELAIALGLAAAGELPTRSPPRLATERAGQLLTPPDPPVQTGTRDSRGTTSTERTPPADTGPVRRRRAVIVFIAVAVVAIGSQLVKSPRCCAARDRV